jgi:hypothetical protein
LNREFFASVTVSIMVIVRGGLISVNKWCVYLLNKWCVYLLNKWCIYLLNKWCVYLLNKRCVYLLNKRCVYLLNKRCVYLLKLGRKTAKRKVRHWIPLLLSFRQMTVIDTFTGNFISAMCACILIDQGSSVLLLVALVSEPERLIG